MKSILVTGNNALFIFMFEHRHVMPWECNSNKITKPHCQETESQGHESILKSRVTSATNSCRKLRRQQGAIMRADLWTQVALSSRTSSATC